MKQNVTEEETVKYVFFFIYIYNADFELYHTMKSGIHTGYLKHYSQAEYE